MARIPASGVRRSCDTHATSSRRLRLERGGPLPGLGRAGPRSAASSRGQLGELRRTAGPARRRPRGAGPSPSRRAIAPTDARRGADPPAEHDGDDRPPTAAGADEDDPQDPQVVARDEHRPAPPSHARARPRATGARAATDGLRADAERRRQRSTSSDRRARRPGRRRPPSSRPAGRRRRRGCRPRPRRPRRRPARRRRPPAAPATAEPPRTAGSRLEPVADAPHRAQVARRRRVGLDLLAQPADVHGDRRRVAVGEAPDLARAAPRGGRPGGDGA